MYLLVIVVYPFLLIGNLYKSSVRARIGHYQLRTRTFNHTIDFDACNGMLSKFISTKSVGSVSLAHFHLISFMKSVGGLKRRLCVRARGENLH